MVGSSKILTVSYGTFSCTLEGFDDPFNAMRSIAEYFRDLAAEDRYFGAEPPTPDADMLHQIAQRSGQRRVEAVSNDDGIVLRQVTDETQAAAPAVDPEATESAEEPVAASPAADVVERLYAEDEEAAANADLKSDTGSPAATPELGDSVAAKLSRIRAVVAGNGAAVEAKRNEDRFSGSIDSAFIDDAVVEDAEISEPQAVQTVAERESEPEPEPEPETSESVDAAATTTEDAEAADSNVTPIFPAEAPTAPALKQSPGATKISMAEDLAAGDPAPQDMPAYPEVASKPEATPDETSQTADQTSMGLAARIVMLKQAALNAPEPYADATSDDGEEFEDLDAAPSLEEFEETAELVVDVDPAAATPDVTVDDDDADAEDTTPDPLADSREAIKAAIVRAAELEKEDAPEEAHEEEPPTRRQSFDSGDGDELALKRILEQTNSRMDDSEGSRRRSAIAHLKAAVAATKADRALKPDTDVDDADEQSQYRDDLARVVQAAPQPETPAKSPDPDLPPTPEASEEGSPLVLVSEQRIPDEGEDTEDEVFDNEGFAEFASRVGASDLPDLLEAAAAYTAFIEGNKLFSRPQLMKRVAHLDARQEFSREAGLRSFGQLLRQGKIQKLKRGQFTISEDTRFNPQERLAGQ